MHVLLFSEKKTWFRNAVLALIAAYKQYNGLADKAGFRSSQIYEKISAELKKQNFNFTSKQCKWKFATLKKKYHKYKDAQKPGNTGGTPVNFQYVDEFDDIFSESHSHGLPCVASSSRYVPVPFSETNNSQDDASEEETTTPPKKRQRRRVTVSETIKNTIDHLQTESAKHHEEKMKAYKESQSLMERQLDLQERAVTQHNELMLKLIEKM